jgi:hypothetical protein
MGDIIFDASNCNKMPTRVFIERNVDDIEKQKLQFILDSTSTLVTETGNSITFFGRDRKGNTVELIMDISAKELKKALERF